MTPLDFSKVKTVRMVIFQPRLQTQPECPEWSCDLPTLEVFAEKAKAAAERVEAARYYTGFSDWEERFLVPSEKGCQWCKAKSRCPALAKACLTPVLAAADDSGLYDLDAGGELALIEVGGGIEELPLTDSIVQAIANIPTLDFQSISRIYAAKGRILAFLEAIDDRMLQEMLAGEKHRDYKLVKGRGGNRAWRDSEEAEVTLKSFRLKSDEIYDKSIISPTKAEMLLKKRPKLWAKLQPIISRGDGKVKIAPMSSKQESINLYDDDLAGLPDFSCDDLI